MPLRWAVRLNNVDSTVIEITLDDNDEEQGLGLKTNNGKTTTRRSMVPLSGLPGHTGLYDATHRQPARVGKKPVADDIGVADFY